MGKYQDFGHLHIQYKGRTIRKVMGGGGVSKRQYIFFVHL